MPPFAARRRARRWLLAVALLSLLCGLAAGGWFTLLRSTPERTARGYMDALIRGDQTAAQRYLSADSRGTASMSLPGPQRGARDDLPYSLGSVAVYGATAAVPVNLDLPGTTAFERRVMTLMLVREGWAWKVNLSETGRQMLRESSGDD